MSTAKSRACAHRGLAQSLPLHLALRCSPEEVADPIELVIQRRAREHASSQDIELHISSKQKTLAASTQRQLTESCSELLQKSDAGSENAIFNIAMHLKEEVLSLPADSPVEDASTEHALSRQDPELLRIKRTLIWSHHLLAISKRKDIVAWSAELQLAGLSKPGYVLFLSQAT